MKRVSVQFGVVGACVAAAFAALVAAAPASAQTYGDCEVSGTKGSMPIKPVTPGQLTVQVSLPAPGWWNGDSPDAMKDGYEYCMAANIAYRAGLDKVKVVNVSFDALVAAQTKDYDMALAEISITEPRKKVVDFSTPYFASDIGVLVKKGTTYDKADISKMRIGVMQGTTGAAFVANKLHPAEVKVFPDQGVMSTALAANQVDAVVHDTSLVLGMASQASGALTVPAQYSTGESYGAIYPKGSANEDQLNKIIESLMKDGTLAKFATKYLADAWGSDPNKVPYLQP
ncbi:ABC transporter substrate-binding protein [Labrys neptuniae]